MDDSIMGYNRLDASDNVNVSALSNQSSNKIKGKGAIHRLDEYVGMRIRKRRIVLGLSQKDIGELTGITFQQVQKYEKGINRIAISRLYEFAKILQVSVEWFLEGFESDAKQKYRIAQADNKETLALIRTYFSIPPPIRKKALSLMQAISILKPENLTDMDVCTYLDDAS
jgi:transcriptional regulator with XRE-family HTH domain